MKNGLFSVLLVTLFVTACSNFHREDKPLQVEGNSRIVQVNQSVLELKDKFGIELEPVSQDSQTTAKKFDWSRYSKADRQRIQDSLQSVIDNSNRIFEIARNKNMRVTGSLSPVLEASVNATYFLKSAQTYDQLH